MALFSVLAGCASLPPALPPDRPDLGAVVRLRGVGDCLAVRVAPDALLTAAHCVLGVRSIDDIRVDGATVVGCALHPALAARFGRCDTDDRAAPGRIHDDWTDLALVRVSPASDAPRLAVMAALDMQSTLGGFDAWVVSDGAPRWVAAVAPRLVHNRVSLAADGEICTLGAEPADISTRPGDSGGPLLLRRGGGWVVAGVLGGGLRAYSGDSHYAATYLPDTAAWIGEAMRDRRSDGGRR